MREWRDAVGYEDLYNVSSDGKIFSKRSGREIVLGESEGYDVISTRVGGRKGKALCLKVHRLVANTFLEAPSEELIAECKKTVYGKVVVRHKDSNKKNNNFTNLCWGTYQNNSDDMKQTEQHATRVANILRGQESPYATLTNDQVVVLRKRYKPFSKTDGVRALAKELNVHHTTVSRAIRGVHYT